MMLKILLVKSSTWFIIQGMNIISDSATMTILGIKVKVISWTWVTAWNIEIMRPINSPDNNIGADINSIVIIASRPTVMTISADMRSSG